MAPRHDCIQEAKIEMLISRMDRVEVKQDNTAQMVKDLKDMFNKSMFLMAGAMLTAVANLLMMVINK